MARRGFSFTEVLIGLVLLVLAIFPLYSLLLAGFSGSAASVMHARAFGLARSVVELAGALPFDDLTADRAETIAREIARDEKDFTLRARVVAPDRVVPLARIPGRSMRYRQVVVEVSWARRGDPARRGESSQLALSTIQTRME
jgi:hypothetical protein